MADQDRTEKPTARRRGEARKQGRVARSPDLGGAATLLAGLLAISLLAPHIVQALANCMRAMLATISSPQSATTAAGLHALLQDALSTVVAILVPVCGACLLAGVGAGVAQVGGRPRPQALKIDPHRISPMRGAKNLLGPNTLFEAVKALAKVAIVALIAGLSLIPNISGLASKVGIEPLALGSLAGSRALAVAEHAAFAYLLVGLVDYAWRRRQLERSLRMTKQEVKDEMRQHNLPNEVRRALRRRQAQLAKARMMAAVPEADVVVTNPTHFAVALRYDGSEPAPEVIAKGQDLIAAQIRRVAEEHGVPVVADPPLARALYSSTEIGQMIPAELYVAVARVLAFVYRLAHRRAPAPAGALR